MYILGTRNTVSNQHFPTETTMCHINFLNDLPPFQVHPAPRIGQLNLSRYFAVYRRSQVGVADLSHPVRFQSARNYFGTHTLSSFPPVDDYEIMSERDQFSEHISLVDLMTPQSPLEQQFNSDEISFCGPYAHLFLGGLDIQHGLTCDVCFENLSFNLPIDPIRLRASQFGSNRDFAHIPSLCEYCHRAINPIFIGNRLCVGVNELEVADLRGSQLSHPLIHEQADLNWNRMRSGPPVLPYVMRTERHLHRNFGPYAHPRCSYNRASSENFAGFREGPYRVQIAGLSPQMMESDAHGFVEHEVPPFAPNVDDNSGGGSFNSSGESATVTQNFLDMIDNPSSLEQTVGSASASNPPNNIEDNAVGVATNPDRGNGKMAMENEAEEDHAGPSVKLPFTWL